MWKKKKKKEKKKREKGKKGGTERKEEEKKCEKYGTSKPLKQGCDKKKRNMGTTPSL